MASWSNPQEDQRLADAIGNLRTEPREVAGFSEWYLEKHGEKLRGYMVENRGKKVAEDRKHWYSEDPTDFFVATKTQDELPRLAESEDDRIAPLLDRRL